MSFPRTAPRAHRAAVVAADVMAIPGALTTSVVAGGALPDATYKSKVVAVNAYGRTTSRAGTDRATSGANNSVRIAFAAVVGATHYDIYLSTDADPKFVCRVTEAQRASGILITALNTTSAGGSANSVDVRAAGTGQASDTTAAVNTAYVIPTGISAQGYQYADFDVAMTMTGDVASPACVLVPYFYNQRLAVWYAGDPQTISFGGAAGAYKPLKQRVRVETRGASQVALVVQSISGTGAELNIDCSLS